MFKKKSTMTVLHENSFGNISKCSCCDELQLTLGNVIICFSEEEYADFDIFFNEIREDFKKENRTKSKSKKYVIRTNQNGLILNFSYKELKQTIELLNFSTIMLSVNKLTTS